VAVAAHKKKTGKPFILTAAAFSVGAYYNGDYVKAKP
jgi:chitinase